MGNIIEKFTPPNQLVKQPYGTIYMVNSIDNKELPYTQYYIQASKKHIKWLKFSTLLELTFIDKINDQDFIEKCLKKFQE